MERLSDPTPVIHETPKVESAPLERLLSDVDGALSDLANARTAPDWDYFEAFSRHNGLLTRAEQERLRECRVAIVGMGGAGGIHLATLARLGIGRFTIADPDRFELANMNRQHGSHMGNLGRLKVDVMADELRQINPEAQIRVFPEAICAETERDFLNGADLFVDAIDFFALDIRRRLFRQAAENGIYGVSAGPVGFGAAWLVFAPDGIRFDRYFDLNDAQSEIERLIAFVTGLTPALLQRPYLDLEGVNLAEGRGPSAALACQICAGVVAAEALKILLGRGGVRCAPSYSQFDAYRCRLRQGRLFWGNRGPIQRLKRWWVKRLLASSAFAR
jgi:molybdopterin/thiamine biosynthesis adenylyltransferase